MLKHLDFPIHLRTADVNFQGNVTMLTILKISMVMSLFGVYGHEILEVTAKPDC